MLAEQGAGEEGCIEFKGFIKIDKEDKDCRKGGERGRVNSAGTERVRLN